MFSEESEMQICYHCGLEKDSFEFPTNAPFCESCSRDYRRLYQKQHPEVTRKIQTNRRARKLNVFVEYIDPAVVYQRDEGMCYLCGLPAERDNWHLEHKVPISKGGPHSYDNVGVSHPDCNFRKGVA
jgi:5-methylcytosine-specific restriction endonuclease McrA